MFATRAWRNQARCAGAPVEEFLMVTPDTDEAGVLWPHQLWELNRARLQAAIDTYCSGCPVTQECWDDAEQEGHEDALYTVRGGRFPVLLDLECPEPPSVHERGQGRPFKGYSVDADGVWRCFRGHSREEDGYAVRKDGGKACVACASMRHRAGDKRRYVLAV